MAHYAYLDENNIVTQVFVGKDEADLPQGIESWEIYYGEKENLRCLRTSYNTFLNAHREGKTPFRGNYAGIGYLYLGDLNIFVPTKPYDSWVLDEAICNWVSPTPYPTDGKNYRWDEPTISWVEIPEENTGE